VGDLGQNALTTATKTGDDVSNAYEVAKAGGKHKDWYRRQLALPDPMLLRAVKSFQKLIKEHEDLIQNPTEKYPEFPEWDVRRQRNLVEHHWPADIARHREFIEILEGLLQERNHGTQ
jgi:hypothetical protein